MQVLLWGIFHLHHVEIEQLWWQKTFQTPPRYFAQESWKIIMVFFFSVYKMELPIIYGTVYIKSKYRVLIFRSENMFWSQRHPISCMVTWFQRQSYELHLQSCFLFHPYHFRCFICLCSWNKKLNTLSEETVAHSHISEKLTGCFHPGWWRKDAATMQQSSIQNRIKEL